MTAERRSQIQEQPTFVTGCSVCCSVQWLLFADVTAIPLLNVQLSFITFTRKRGWTLGKNIPLRALWGVPAKWLSRVELVPGVVYVGTSLCAFLKKSSNSWLLDPSRTSPANSRPSHLCCWHFALEEANAKVLGRFKYFFTELETSFWVNLRQLEAAVSEFWAVFSPVLTVAQAQVRVWAARALPHQLFFSVQNDVFSPRWLPRESPGVIPFSQLHLHLCGPSLSKSVVADS